MRLVHYYVEYFGRSAKQRGEEEKKYTVPTTKQKFHTHSALTRRRKKMNSPFYKH